MPLGSSSSADTSRPCVERPRPRQLETRGAPHRRGVRSGPQADQRVGQCPRRTGNRQPASAPGPPHLGWLPCLGMGCRVARPQEWAAAAALEAPLRLHTDLPTAQRDPGTGDADVAGNSIGTQGSGDSHRLPVTGVLRPASSTLLGGLLLVAPPPTQSPLVRWPSSWASREGSSCPGSRS